jgi:gamma-glutamylputrescine oxidase
MAQPSDEPVWGPATRWESPPPLARADVVVIGGGISGVSMLHWLRLRGVDAVLFERDGLHSGASGRNAGFLLCGVAENYARAVATYGRDDAATIWAFTAENHVLTRELIGDADAGYARCGSWTLAATAEEALSLEEAATLLREDGLPGQWSLDLPVPYQAHRGGLLNAVDGQVHPARLVRLIAEPHRDRVFTGTEVRGIEPGNGSVRVTHSQGETEAGAVVMATNAWTSTLLPDVDIRPVRAQMAATAPDPAVILDRPAYAGWGFRYWRQLDDGRVICGGFRDYAVEEEVGLAVATTETLQRHIDGQLEELGVSAAVERRWAGTMGFSTDHIPLVGPYDGHTGVHLLGGYTGHGMAFAVHCARVLTAHLCDGAPIPRWLDARRAQLSPSVAEAASGPPR